VKGKSNTDFPRFTFQLSIDDGRKAEEIRGILIKYRNRNIIQK
jgi:hypothetical protein